MRICKWYSFANALVIGNPRCECLKKEGNITSVCIGSDPHSDDRGCEGVCEHGNSFVVVPAGGKSPFVENPGDEQYDRIWVM